MKQVWKKWLIEVALFILNKLSEQYMEPKTDTVLKQSIFLQNVAKLIEYGHSLPGYVLTGGELWRTADQQAIYLSKGLTKTKFSRHQQRLAIDINVFVDGVLRMDAKAYEPLAKFWNSLNVDNTCGYCWV